MSIERYSQSYIFLTEENTHYIRILFGINVFSSITRKQNIELSNLFLKKAYA
jgi:hypothetical protein